MAGFQVKPQHMEKCSNRDSFIKILEKDMIHTGGNRGPGWMFAGGYFQS